MPKIGEQRIKFNYGEQKTFIFAVKECLGLEWKDFAQLIGVHRRTLQDWSKEKYNIPLDVAETISKKSNIAIPKSAYIYKWGDHLHEASCKGGSKTLYKYGKIGGSTKRRKQKWKEWWLMEGQFRKNSILDRKDINKPAKSKELAEFVGVILGDGGISNYQVTVALHAIDDKRYGGFVTSLIEKLFDVPVGIYKSKTDASVHYYVSRVELVDFCVEFLGLVKGNKITHQVDIPRWIKNNKEYLSACVRGLVDTDGSVFVHTYRVNGKIYKYTKMNFTSNSEPLRRSVYEGLNKLNVPSRLDGRNNVWIDSKSGVKKYFSIIGSHNPKHLDRCGL